MGTKSSGLIFLMSRSSREKDDYILILSPYSLRLTASEEPPKIDANLLSYHPPRNATERYNEKEIARGGQWWKRKQRQSR